jgi:predicted permease
MELGMSLFVQVVLPILLVIGAGAWLQARGGLHVQTLSRLTVYVLVPAFLFVRVYESRLGWGEIGGVLLAVFIPMALLGFPMAWGLSRLGVGGATAGAMTLCALVFNAGNVGIPVASFFYGTHGAVFPGMKAVGDGEAVQALVVMGSNLSLWLVGYVVLSLAGGKGVRGVLGFFRLPMIYTLAAAFALRAWLPAEGWGGEGSWCRVGLEPGLRLVRLMSRATVPVMLLTLGAQLAASARWPRWRRVGPVLAVKLGVLPVVTAGVVWGLGMWPWPGAQLVIASAAPSAINTLLLAIEVDGDAETAADCVFWSTLASALTLTATLGVMVRVAGVGGLAGPP